MEEKISEMEDTIIDTIQNANTESKRLEKMKKASVSYGSQRGSGAERKNYLKK